MTAGTATAVPAAPPAPLPADFLEYLGSWEADDADWLIASAAAQVAPKPAAAANPASPQPATTPRGYTTTTTPPPAQTTTERKP
jgi:hypothetical protein